MEKKPADHSHYETGHDAVVKNPKEPDAQQKRWQSVHVILAPERDDGGVSFGCNFMSGIAFQLCLKSAAQTGLIVLDILTLMFPQRAATTGFQAQIAKIKPFY